MSRCFPFPPPGYQPPGHHATARSEPLDLLAKEKHKERKHKKDKKDGEKKDKDRSKDKHKEKKDRKEKHRDKKKDKDKSKTSDDRKTEDRSEGHHGVKLKDNGVEDQGLQDSKFREELGRRIRDEEKGPSNSMSESFPGSIHRRNESMVTAPAMENHRISGTEMNANSISRPVKRNNVMGLPVDEFAGSSQKIEGIGSAAGMENDRDTGNNTATSLTSTDNRRNHGLGSKEKSVGSMQERSQGRSVGSKEEERSAIKVSNAMVPSSIGTEQTTNYTADKPLGAIQERLQGKFVTSDARERGATKISNNIGTVVPVQEQRKDYRLDRPVDPISPMSFEGIRPALGKEKAKSNTMVSHPFDPIEGRNDGIGDRAESSSPRGRGRQMSANLTAMEQKRTDGIGGSVRNNLDNSMEGKKTKDREADASKVERHRDGDKTEKKSKKDKDRHKERRKEKKKEKERTKEKGEHKHKQDSKLRDKEKGENKHKEDAKLRDREKGGDNKHKEDAKLRDNGKRDTLHSTIKPSEPQKEIAPDPMIKPLAPPKEIVPDRMIKPSAPQKEILPDRMVKSSAPQKDIVPDRMIKPLAPPLKDNMFDSMSIPLAPQKDNANNAAAAAATDGNINKRKDIKMNGFLHENIARPTKIMRTSLPTNTPLENGRALESHPATGSSGSALNAVIARVPDNKEHKSNGIKESRPTPVDLRPAADAKVSAGAVTKVAVKPPHPDKAAAVTKAAVKVKPPHPDLKYLDRVYTVPKTEEWAEFDDQEWLFSKDDIRPKPKSTTETEETETPLVWAEAMQIDDVLALPYVIPF